MMRAMRRSGFTLVELMIVLAIIAVAATLVIANLATSRIAGNETSALKTIRAIQEFSSVYKKKLYADADANGIGEYPDAAGAGWAAMVDEGGNPLIGIQRTSGNAHGYDFTVTRGATTPENTCYASGVPQSVGATGNRSFCMANDGICYASPTAQIPPADYLQSDGGAGSPGGDFTVAQE